MTKELIEAIKFPLELRQSIGGQAFAKKHEETGRFIDESDPLATGDEIRLSAIRREDSAFSEYYYDLYYLSITDTLVDWYWHMTNLFGVERMLIHDLFKHIIKNRMMTPPVRFKELRFDIDDEGESGQELFGIGYDETETSLGRWQLYAGPYRPEYGTGHSVDLLWQFMLHHKPDYNEIEIAS